MQKTRWLAQSWRGKRLVKFIFDVTKTWNAPRYGKANHDLIKIINQKQTFFEQSIKR